MLFHAHSVRVCGLCDFIDVLKNQMQSVAVQRFRDSKQLPAHRRLRSTQLAMDTAATVKGKRVSTQVHRMLLKAKAVGDKKLRIEDRFFLDVHYW